MKKTNRERYYTDEWVSGDGLTAVAFMLAILSCSPMARAYERGDVETSDATSEDLHDGTDGQGHHAGSDPGDEQHIGGSDESGDEHEEHSEEGHEEHSEHSHRFFAGLKGMYLAAFEEESWHHHGGGVLFFEVVLVHGWLELELAYAVLGGQHSVKMPIDLLLKVPFKFHRVVHPFIGVGPVMAVLISEEHTSVHFGVVAAVGAYFWLSNLIAISTEVLYSALFHGGVAHEVGGSVGLVFGW